MTKDHHDKARTPWPPRVAGFILDAVAVTVTAFCVVSVLPAFLPMLDPRLDLLANGVPLFAVVALAVLAIVIVSRRHTAVIAVTIAGLLAPSLLMASDMVRGLAWGDTASTNAQRIKIVSANLWSSNESPRAFLEMLAREQPEILFLQEAYGMWKPALDALAPTYRFVAGCTYPNECNAVVFSNLTKVGDITPLASPYVTARLELPDRLGGGFIEVMSVHLTRPPPMAPQRDQMTEIIATANSFGPSSFIAGDFNATPWTGALRYLDNNLGLVRRTGALFSWPTPLPVAPIDHIYAGKNWHTVDIRRGPDIGSDHYPIIATFVRTKP
jgi:endonuclease/exonuclease/phosphatase (EEP) superfamily protein YafD